MKNRHFFILILLIQISVVGLIWRETPTKFYFIILNRIRKRVEYHSSFFRTCVKNCSVHVTIIPLSRFIFNTLIWRCRLMWKPMQVPFFSKIDFSTI